MPKKPKPATMTLESGAFLEGLFKDFRGQVSRYKFLTGKLMEIEAQLQLAEKTLALTRDHLGMALKTTEGSADRMKDFKKESAYVRFVGMRLTDACTVVLKERKKLRAEKLLDEVNEGTFRFKSNAPLREIHAALLKHPHVQRQGDYYIWIPPTDALTVTPTTPSVIPEETGGEK
jgi:hypothetical protein